MIAKQLGFDTDSGDHPDGGNHHWVIEPPRGALSLGVCECTATRYFANSEEAVERLSGKRSFEWNFRVGNRKA